MADYLNAVKFVSYKLVGDSNTIAYAKTFPDRYQRLVDKNTPMKTISSFSTAYNKGDLVHRILERTLVPVHILNMDIHQEAINVQAELMRDAKSETVRQKAAECLITQLKAPETAKIEIDVNYSNDSIDELRETTRALAQQQLKMIKSGAVTAEHIAHSDIIARKKDSVETEYEEVQ
jgi:phosphopantetheine adenylyltransferase